MHWSLKTFIKSFYLLFPRFLMSPDKFKQVASTVQPIDLIITDTHDALGQCSLCGTKRCRPASMTVHKSKGLESGMSLFSIWTRHLTVRINQANWLPSRQKGIGFKYVATLPVDRKLVAQKPFACRSKRLLPTKCGRNKIGYDFEQMRLLYVAMHTGWVLSGRKIEDNCDNTKNQPNGKLDPKTKVRIDPLSDWLFGYSRCIVYQEYPGHVWRARKTT